MFKTVSNISSNLSEVSDREIGATAEESQVMDITSAYFDLQSSDVNSNETSGLSLINTIDTDCPSCVYPTIIFSTIGVFMVIIGIIFLVKEHRRRRRSHKFINTNNSRTHCNSIHIIYQ